MYLNRYFLALCLRCWKAASNKFFGVTDLNKLTVARRRHTCRYAMSPSAYNPVKNPEATEKRRNIVLGLMKKTRLYFRKNMKWQKQLLSKRP
ncbi:transglycosylase domain-containing protein [Bacillus sp. SL00103]